MPPCAGARGDELGNRVLADLTAGEVKAAVGRVRPDSCDRDGEHRPAGPRARHPARGGQRLGGPERRRLGADAQGPGWQAEQGADRRPGRRGATGVARGPCGAGVPRLSAAAAGAYARADRAVPAGRDPHRRGPGATTGLCHVGMRDCSVGRPISAKADLRSPRRTRGPGSRTASTGSASD